MPTATDKAIRYPTREELDAAWTRLAEKYGEGTLADSADLLTVANGIAELRARLTEAEGRIELAYNALWDETADDNTKILLASHYLMNGDPADDDD